MYDSRIDTHKHRNDIHNYLNKIIIELLNRGCQHDFTKLISPEKDILDEVVPKLKNIEYGSAEYIQEMKKLEPMSQHHYQNNNHHPEFYINGINDMDLVDLCEMICDWKSAVKRNKNGNIFKSIEINQKRYGYSDELKNILKNTVERFLS